jgi:ribosome-associated protein
MEQTLKEKSLEHETIVEDAPETAEIVEALDERIEIALRAASDKKAVNPLVLDLQPVADFTSYFVITSGTNLRQVQAITDGIEEELKKIGTRPSRIEGYNSAEWILMDYGDFIVHVFEEKIREFYDLERLWRDAKRLQIPADI